MGRASHATIELRAAINKFSPDIICIQEPYNLKGSPIDFLRSYTLAYNAPSPKCCILTSAETSCTLLPELSDSLICVCETQIASSPPLFVVNCYLPSSVPIDHLLERIQTIACLLSVHDIIVAGDFNAQSPSWFSQRVNSRGCAVETMLCESGFSVHNSPQSLTTFEAAVGRSNIDLTLSSLNRFTIINWKVTDDISCSDHNLISFSVEILTPRVEVSIPSRAFFTKSNWKEISKQIKKLVPRYNSQREIQDTMLAIKQIAYNNWSSRPLRSSQGFLWTPSLLKLRSSVRYLRSKFSRDRDKNTLRKFRTMRNTYVTALRKAKFDAWFAVACRNNSPWGLAHKSAFGRLPKKRALQGDISLNFLTNANNSSLSETTAYEVLSNLFPPDTFANDSADHAALRQRFQTIIPLVETASSLNTVSRSDVSRAIDAINPKKAPGPDNIPHSFWRFVNLVRPDILANIFDFCLSHGIFPSDWKIAKVILLKKNPNSLDPSNNAVRPISLLPIIGKIYERILLHKLYDEIPECDLISPFQYGFRKGKSTIDALFSVQHQILNSPHKYIILVFMDIKKAFDTAWWPMIFHRLSNLPISPNLLAALKDFLSDRTVTLTNGSNSYNSSLSRGCPQGSVLSPVLWNILIDSIFEIPLPPACSPRAFADDIAIIIEGDSRASLEAKARAIMSCLNDWAQANKLAFSPEKSKCLLVRGSLKRAPTVKLAGTNLQFVPEFKYLGIWLRRNLDFSHHIQTMCASLKCLLPAFSTYKKSVGPRGQNKLKLIYKQVILPKLTYGVALWGRDLRSIPCRKALTSLKRSFLIRMTGAFPTSPGTSLDVITFTEPLLLTLEKMYALYHPKYTNTESTYEGVVICPDSITSGKSPLTQVLATKLLALWERTWAESPHKWTGLFFPTIKSRCETTWFHPSQPVSRYLTGHCSCRAYLKRFNLNPSDKCDCG